jgi:hypothetical protein
MQGSQLLVQLQNHHELPKHATITLIIQSRDCSMAGCRYTGTAKADRTTSYTYMLILGSISGKVLWILSYFNFYKL